MKIVKGKDINNYVFHSNAIEGIQHNEIVLFQNHKKVVKDTLKFQGLTDPRNIVAYFLTQNKISKDSTPAPIDYRNYGENVGDYICPSPEFVPAMMKEWHQHIQNNFIKFSRKSDIKETEEFAFEVHHWFLCIHPFEDGNGRTARLFWNNLRIMLGLSWKTIYFSEREKYYQDIIKWQNEVFIPEIKSRYLL